MLNLVVLRLPQPNFHTKKLEYCFYYMKINSKTKHIRILIVIALEVSFNMKQPDFKIEKWFLSHSAAI